MSQDTQTVTHRQILRINSPKFARVHRLRQISISSLFSFHRVTPEPDKLLERAYLQAVTRFVPVPTTLWRLAGIHMLPVNLTVAMYLRSHMRIFAVYVTFGGRFSSHLQSYQDQRRNAVQEIGRGDLRCWLVIKRRLFRRNIHVSRTTCASNFAVSATHI
jgi:hypothetical protein